jgi:hypothetical protein
MAQEECQVFFNAVLKAGDPEVIDVSKVAIERDYPVTNLVSKSLTAPVINELLSTAHTLVFATVEPREERGTTQNT